MDTISRAQMKFQLGIRSTTTWSYKLHSTVSTILQQLKPQTKVMPSSLSKATMTEAHLFTRMMGDGRENLIKHAEGVYLTLL